MKRYALFLSLAAVIGLCSVSAFAQNHAGGGAGGNGHAFGLNKLLCFSGTDDGDTYGGTCTLVNRGASRNSAVIDTDDGDPDGSYAGVYSNNRNIYGRPLSQIGTLSFKFSGDAASAGSPRFSVPVDTDGDGDTELFAFISAYYCNDGTGYVSASNPGCTIYTGDGGSYTSLAALTAAYPNAKIATDNYVFIISDEPGTWTITDVKFGNPGKGNGRR